MKKTLVTLSLALFVAAGCSGEDDEPEASPTSTGATVETTTGADQPPGAAEDLNDVGVKDRIPGGAGSSCRSGRPRFSGPCLTGERVFV